jgi:hypothetical protein
MRQEARRVKKIESRKSKVESGKKEKDNAETQRR